MYLAVLIMIEEVSLLRNVNICNTQYSVMFLYPKSMCEVLRIWNNNCNVRGGLYPTASSQLRASNREVSEQNVTNLRKWIAEILSFTSEQVLDKRFGEWW